MRHLESQFQQAVVRYLKLNNIFCFSVPNGTQLKITQARIAKAEGMMAGVSDLIILLPNGRCVFAELKSPNGKGRQSDLQKEFELKVKGLGFEYYLWDNWDTIENFVKKIKIVERQQALDEKNKIKNLI